VSGSDHHRREVQDRTNSENLVVPQDCGNDPGAIYVGYIPQVADGVDVSRTATVAPTDNSATLSVRGISKIKACNVAVKLLDELWSETTR
jgi:hypothetical protein